MYLECDIRCYISSPIMCSLPSKMKNNKTLRCEPGDCGRSNLPNFTENDLLLRGGAKKGSNGRANSIHMMDDADVSG